MLYLDLAVGVNLPARRVIIYGFEPGDDKATKLHQMIGRAGRYGLDTSGSAVIFCSNDTEFDAALAMYRGAARSFGHTDRDSISLTAPPFFGPYRTGRVRGRCNCSKKKGAVPSRGGTGDSDQFDRGGLGQKRQISGTFLILRVRLFQ